ncbi:uncharacterized protein J8A68_000106 [[Candida] subhashii]|uniref:Dienelactone hydrolase domain-containing protein n=1 Tax=[Candida] subhashii TaxID=561895 RepID=A0A8J5USF3_9ASCO|nr:uncharacterized protein J8A68_000106 [[Candida] subhashii]KAG7666361.1 hypothetical protein J8A68_000106 [[Candida] subhashii]
MASHPPSTCCLKASFHEGTPIGKHQELFGVDTYVVGESDKVIVIMTDIYGNRFNNIMLIADEFSRKGYKVLIPDILLNDAIEYGKFDFSTFGEWRTRHTPEITAPIVDGFLKQVKHEINPKYLTAIGYCFGAKYTVQQLAEGKYLDAGALAHPSMVTIEEVQAIAKPILISAAEVDQSFTRELRYQTEEELTKKGNVRFQIDVFQGVTHGYAVKGAESEPLTRYAIEKTLQDQVCFLDHVNSLRST